MDAQRLGMNLEITPSMFEEPYGMLGVESKSLMCKASFLPDRLSLLAMSFFPDLWDIYYMEEQEE